MWNQTSRGGRERPRQVTLGGMQAVAGSVLALVLLMSTAQQLNGAKMTDALTQVVTTEQVAALDLTVENARTLLRYTIMGLSVLSAASLVLGIYVLRRHSASRIGLTVIGAVVGVIALLGGPVGWAATLYIGVSIFLIWSRPARAWFSQTTLPSGRGGPSNGKGPGDAGLPGGSGTPPSGADAFGPPAGPRRDVDGVLPPAPRGPESGPDDAPPPTPPPRRR